MIEIRWAQLDDIQQLGLVHSDAYQNAYQGIIPDEYLNKVTPKAREAFFHAALTEGNVHVAIALVDKKTVGCMVLKVGSDEDIQCCDGEITAIYLLQTYRGTGHGKKFLEWGLGKLKAFGCAKIGIWVLRANINAIRFYEKQGFVRDGAVRTISRGKDLIQLRYTCNV